MRGMATLSTLMQSFRSLGTRALRCFEVPRASHSATVLHRQAGLDSQRLPGISLVRWLVLPLVGLGLQVGCGGGSASQGGLGANVYVVGYESNGQTDVATCWKNGTPIVLSDGVHAARAYGITVSGGDVFICGTDRKGAGAAAAVYWKNGQEVSLTDGTRPAVAIGIAVSGGHVYAVGYEDAPSSPGFGVATLWVDGVPTALTDGTQMAQANAVAVAGSDVYIAGWEYQTHLINPTTYYTVSQAVCWKNGVKTTLTDAANGGGAFGIAVLGTDVYVCGNEFLNRVGVTKIWKNGVPITLTDGTRNANALAIALDGDSFRVAGFQSVPGGTEATLWSNTMPAILSSGQASTVANSLALSSVDGSVYAAGAVDGPNGVPIAIYWAGDRLMDLTDGTRSAQAFGIAVAPGAM